MSACWQILYIEKYTNLGYMGKMHYNIHTQMNFEERLSELDTPLPSNYRSTTCPENSFLRPPITFVVVKCGSQKCE